MSKKTITVEHGGITYTGVVATITRTELGTLDHGVVSSWLHCVWEDGGIGVGGYTLDDKPQKGKTEREGTAFGLDQIMQILETVGVKKWEALAGKQVIVLFEEGRSWLGGMSVGIANLLTDKVFILSEHALSWKERKN